MNVPQKAKRKRNEIKKRNEVADILIDFPDSAIVNYKKYMNVQYGAKRAVVRPSHTMYVATLMAFVWGMDLDYVTKMRYNKDKDLVFVTKPDRFWGESEHVYEMHHLE